MPEPNGGGTGNGDTRSYIEAKLYMASCPACPYVFYAIVKVKWPMTDRERELIKARVLKEADATYEKHFAMHSEEISDLERCAECMLLPKGHATCSAEECICICTTYETKEG